MTITLSEQIELAFNPAQPRDSHGKWTRTPGLSVGDSLSRHIGPDGNLTPERAALHQRIVDDILAGHKPQAHKLATFFGGGSASGKSMLRTSSPDSAHIDADAIKAQLPEYQQMMRTGDPAAAAFSHEESSLISRKAVTEAHRRGLDYTLDGTGDSSFEKLAGKVNGAKAHGYATEGKYVTADTETAVARAMKRAERTGRMVPPSVIRDIHRGVSAVWPEAMAQGLYDRVELHDNNGSAPRLIASKQPGGQLQVTDPAAYQRFLDKAHP